MNILIINRWDDEFSEYDRYIDHVHNSVGYVTTKEGAARLNHRAAATVEVLQAIEPGPQLLRALHRVRDVLGGHVDRVLCLSEYDLLTGAWAREQLTVAGYGTNEVKLFKDKTAMKDAIRSAGVRAPRYAPADDDTAVHALVESIASPIIVKPRVGAASKGCSRVLTLNELERILDCVDRSVYEVEEFVPGPIYHVDGLVRHGCIVFARPSRYINTCLDFAHGLPLGSVFLDPGPKASQIVDFTQASLDALGHVDGCFHLELIDGPDGLCFLEIGARVGGGEIPFVVRDLCGVDLVREWIRIELGGAPRVPRSTRMAGGFLMIPEPPDVPCRVMERTSLRGRIPHLYHEILPEPGTVLDGSGGYEKIGGRFHFRGARESEVEQAIHEAINAYRLVVAAVEPALVTKGRR